MLKGFKEFILRGNVIDLAVAVVIGAAFTAIVTAVVNGIFNPIIGAIFKAESLDSLTWVLFENTTTGEKAELAYGTVIAALIQFLLVAIVLYFGFVMPINHLKKVQFRKKEAHEPDAEDTPPSELEVLLDIRELLASQNADKPAEPGHGKHS
jgi:large conductance mechanosensitive channel